MQVDPACGVVVDEKGADESAVYRDRHYFFCSNECRAAFVRNPDAFLKDPPSQGQVGSQGDHEGTKR